MKLLALSDIHGAYDVADAILDSERPFDGIIAAGDLTTLGSPDETAAALDILLSYGARVAAVCGNMDPVALEDVLTEKEVSVNGTGMIWGTVGIFGVSGSPPTPMRTPYEIPETEIAARAEAGWAVVKDAATTIFVPHAPPHETSVDRIRSGAHVGSAAVRECVERHSPDMVVCGHIHEARGINAIGRTTVVNCGQAGRGYYAVITVRDSVKAELKELR